MPFKPAEPMVDAPLMRRLLPALVALLLLAVPGAASAQQVSTRVVGGSAAEPGEYPWQVALIGRFSGGQFCGGTLVAAQYVLTAAHCIADAADTDVLLGTHSTDPRTGQRIRVAATRNHPQADGVSDPPRFDLTMLRLATPATLSSTVQPLAVVGAGQESWWEPGDLLAISGFGATEEEGPGSPTLQEARVPRTTDAACREAYGSAFAPTDMVCAGYEEGGVDTCQGDSGGPLAAPDPAVASPNAADPAQWRLAGVTSWGAGCAMAGAPGVYARVGAPALRDWTATTPATSASAPTISGTPQAGQALTCASGGWSGGSALYSVRFFSRSTSGTTTLVRESASATYVVQGSDVGRTFFCRVRAENGAATTDSAASNETGPVAPAPAPVSTAAPSVTGEPREGTELTCRLGTWTRAQTITPSFRRLRTDGTSEELSSGVRTYTPGAADVGASIVCIETADNFGTTAQAQSGPAGPVAARSAVPAADPQPAGPPAPVPPALGPAPVPPPGPVGLSINDGARYTNRRDAQLAVVWPLGARTALVDDDGAFAGARVLPLAARLPWRLDDTGPERFPKSVFLRFDGGTQTFSDTIVLDRTRPRILGARVRDAGRRTVVTLRAKDATSGVARMQVTTRRSRPGAFRRFSRRIGAPPRARVLHVRVRDGAGNVSRWRRVRV